MATAFNEGTPTTIETIIVPGIAADLLMHELGRASIARNAGRERDNIDGLFPELVTNLREQSELSGNFASLVLSKAFSIAYEIEISDTDIDREALYKYFASTLRTPELLQDTILQFSILPKNIKNENLTPAVAQILAINLLKSITKPNQDRDEVFEVLEEQAEIEVYIDLLGTNLEIPFPLLGRLTGKLRINQSFQYDDYGINVAYDILQVLKEMGKISNEIGITKTCLSPKTLKHFLSRTCTSRKNAHKFLSLYGAQNDDLGDEAAEYEAQMMFDDYREIAANVILNSLDNNSKPKFQDPLIQIKREELEEYGWHISDQKGKLVAETNHYSDSKFPESSLILLRSFQALKNASAVHTGISMLDVETGFVGSIRDAFSWFRDVSDPHFITRDWVSNWEAMTTSIAKSMEQAGIPCNHVKKDGQSTNPFTVFMEEDSLYTPFLRFEAKRQANGDYEFTISVKDYDNGISRNPRKIIYQPILKLTSGRTGSFASLQYFQLNQD